MPPLGRWLRPVVAAGVTAAIGLSSWLAMSYAQGDIKRLADKYPTVAASEVAKGILSGIPIVGGISAFFAGPIIDTAAEAGLSEDDKKALKLDHAIVTWAPVVGIAGLVVGSIVTFYFLWVDIIRTPTEAERLHELRLAGIAASGQAAGVAIPAVATGGTSIPAQAGAAAIQAQTPPGAPG